MKKNNPNVIFQHHHTLFGFAATLQRIHTRGGSFSLPSFGANFLFAWCVSDVLSHDPWQTPASLNQKANCSFVVVLLVAKLEPCMLLVLH